MLSSQAVPVLAQDSTEHADEEKNRWNLELLYGWTTTRGNDVWLGDALTSKLNDPLDESRDSTLEPLITEMESDLIPFVRGGYRGHRWGFNAEFWTLNTKGSIEGTLRSPTSFENGLLLWDSFIEADPEASYSASNDLSIWTSRWTLTRHLGSSLNLGLGVQLGEYENRRSEGVYREYAPIDSHYSAEHTMNNESSLRMFFVGPSIELDGGTLLGERARVSFTVAQSLLFANSKNEGAWEFGAHEELQLLDLDLEKDASRLVGLELSRRVSMPVTDLRGGLHWDAGEHWSIGVKAMLSIWMNVPVAPQISMLTGRWEESKGTLVFASVGPVVTLRF
jgi:hypothetical protein